MLGDNIDTIEKNTETLIDASKEVGLEITVQKTKCGFSYTTLLTTLITRTRYTG
jgi:hypothetical protein